jgi:hypothetical protein
MNIEKAINSINTKWSMTTIVDSTFKIISFDERLFVPMAKYSEISHGLLLIFETSLISRPVAVFKGLPIPFNRPLKYKIDSDEDLILSINSSLRQIDSNTINHRWFQLDNSIASMEECLLANEMTPNMINVDITLNRHKVISPQDKWLMFRKQANSQYSRLELALLMSKYAKQTNNLKIFDYIAKFVTQYGDLESRPEWVDFNDITVDI